MFEPSAEAAAGFISAARLDPPKAIAITPVKHTKLAAAAEPGPAHEERVKSVQAAPTDTQSANAENRSTTTNVLYPSLRGDYLPEVSSGAAEKHTEDLLYLKKHPDVAQHIEAEEEHKRMLERLRIDDLYDYADRLLGQAEVKELDVNYVDDASGGESWTTESVSVRKAWLRSAMVLA